MDAAHNTEMNKPEQREIESLVEEALLDVPLATEDHFGVQDEDFSRMARAFGLSEEDLRDIYNTEM